jgi:hypothetical protein
MYNEEVKAQSKLEEIELDAAMTLDHTTGMIRRRSSLEVVTVVDTTPKCEKDVGKKSPETKQKLDKKTIAHLKRVVKRNKTNRKKLRSMTQTIDHAAQLIKTTDMLYPIKLFGMRADWKQISAVLALLASTVAAIWRATARARSSIFSIHV